MYRLALEDVSGLLKAEAPLLLDSLLVHEADMESLNSNGWQTVTRHAAAGSNVLQHWAGVDPVSDWDFQQHVAAAKEAAAVMQQMQEAGLLDEYGRPVYGLHTGFMESTVYGAGGCVRALSMVGDIRALKLMSDIVPCGLQVCSKLGLQRPGMAHAAIVVM